MLSSIVTPTSPLPHSNHRINSSTSSAKNTETETTWESYQDQQSFRSRSSLPADMPSFTGDKGEKISMMSAGIGGWFTGTAAPPVTVKIPGEEIYDGIDASHETPSTRTLKRAVTSNTKPPTPQTTPLTTPSPSRFAFFSRSPTVPNVPKIPSNIDDEFLNLDIPTALFPNGPADPFSPSSFKNLLMNAEALLRKLQMAYKARTLAVYELTREKEAQADELEEAETRAAHLKAQLEDLGKKLIQQDHDILSISNELATERQLRAEEKAAHSESLRNTKVHSESSEGKRQLSLVSRGSRSSFESYNLEDGDSVFSQSRSHSSTSSAGTGITTPEMVGQDKNLSSRNSSVSQKATITSNPSPAITKSVFSKLLPGNTTAESSTTEADVCANCKGGNSSVAWDAVGLLRAENKGLKDRLGMLEESVEDALGIVNGAWSS